MSQTSLVPDEGQVDPIKPTKLPILPQFDLAEVALRAKLQYDFDDHRVEQAIDLYRRFLCLCKMHPLQKIVPTADVDIIWHLHILDTVHYVADCKSYFGYYLHHEPCINGVEEEAINVTVRLHTEVFGGLEVLSLQQGLTTCDNPRVTTCANPGGGCGSITL